MATPGQLIEIVRDSYTGQILPCSGLVLQVSCDGGPFAKLNLLVCPLSLRSKNTSIYVR